MNRKIEAIAAVIAGLAVVGVLTAVMGGWAWDAIQPDAEGAPNLVFSDGGYNPDTGTFYIDVAYCPEGTTEALSTAESMDAVLAILDECSGLTTVPMPSFEEWRNYSRGVAYP